MVRENVLRRVVAFCAGALVAAAFVKRRRRSDAAASDALLELRRAVAGLEKRLENQESSTTARFNELEMRIQAEAAKPPEPASIEGIEVLKTAISQTDILLERVLDSIAALQTLTENSIPPDSAR